MSGNRFALDATPLSLLCHPNRRVPDVVEIRTWLRTQVRLGHKIFVPEIADYEVRRELLRLGSSQSLLRLDEISEDFPIIPIDGRTLRRAAEFWAASRRQGKPTAPPGHLDADMILAAQAERVGAVVITANRAHLSQFVAARHWRDDA